MYKIINFKKLLQQMKIISTILWWFLIFFVWLFTFGFYKHNFNFGEYINYLSNHWAENFAKNFNITKPSTYLSFLYNNQTQSEQENLDPLDQKLMELNNLLDTWENITNSWNNINLQQTWNVESGSLFDNNSWENQIFENNDNWNYQSWNQIESWITNITWNENNNISDLENDDFFQDEEDNWNQIFTWNSWTLFSWNNITWTIFSNSWNINTWKQKKSLTWKQKNQNNIFNNSWNFTTTWKTNINTWNKILSWNNSTNSWQNANTYTWLLLKRLRQYQEFKKQLEQQSWNILQNWIQTWNISWNLINKTWNYIQN